MATRTKLNVLSVHRLFLAGSEITPVEAPSHLPEKPSVDQVATAVGELVEALKAVGVFLPDAAAPEADEDADGE